MKRGIPGFIASRTCFVTDAAAWPAEGANSRQGTSILEISAA
jgi:hypothetical protein